MAVRGITKLRNEGHIIGQTLDNWAQYCNAIHVYCDACTDYTADICRDHPAVVEVIESDALDPDRERAEWYCRHTVLHSARRYLKQGDWICYFDGDEWLYDFDMAALESDKVMIATRSFDTYITEEDAHLPLERFAERRFVGLEYELSPYFYRAYLPWDFTQPDQRNMEYGDRVTPDQTLLHGNVRHWGKGLSVTKWEEKCQYYAETFGPKYAAKWKARQGQAVHRTSDFNQPLVLWEDVRAGTVEPVWRRCLSLAT